MCDMLHRMKRNSQVDCDFYDLLWIATISLQEREKGLSQFEELIKFDERSMPIMVPSVAKLVSSPSSTK